MNDVAHKSVITDCIFGQVWKGHIIGEHDNVVILECETTHEKVVIHKESLDPNFKRVRNNRGVYIGSSLKFDLESTQNIFKDRNDLIKYLKYDQKGW